MSNHKDNLSKINSRLMHLFKADKASMTAFKSLSEATVREGSISTALKELIAVSIAAARGCEDCIIYHVAQAKKHGADRESLIEVCAVAIEISGGPGAVYAAKALDAFDNL